MPQIHPQSKSAARRMLALAVLLSLCGAALPPARAAIQPPGVTTNPEAKRLQAAAVQAIRQGNLSLATILLKNALRQDPDNGVLRSQLGFVLLQGGDPASAEREMRQARLSGAKDQDVVPVLLLAMLARKENRDLLGEFPDPPAGDKSKLAVAILRARAGAFQAIDDGANAIAAMDRSLTIQRDASGLLARGEISMLQNQPDAALGFINQSLALAPGSQAGLLMKAAVVRFRDQKAALAILDGLVKAHPESQNAALARIELLIDMGRNDEAQKAVDAVLAVQHTLPLALFYKALLLGVHNQAKEGWAIVQSLPGDFLQSSPRIAVGASQLAVGSGNVESGNTILATYVGQHPSQIEPRLRLAALRVRMNNPADALEVLQPLMDSKDPRVLELISGVYAKLNQSDKTLEFLRKAQAAGSKNPNLTYQLALADLTQNNTAQGTQALAALLKQKPGNLDPAINGVAILTRQSKFAEAQGLADLADTINPKSPVPPFLKGQILFAQNKGDAGPFNQALQRDPHYLPALYARAQIATGQKKFPDAVRDLKQAQALQPGNPLSYVRLAEIAALQGQQAQSLGLLKQAIAKAPKDVPTRLVLARYQMSQRQLPAAAATLQSALQAFPNDPRVLALLGQVQQAMGQKAAALGTNKALSQKYQQSGGAQALLGNSLLASGDKKGAMAAFKRATELSPDVEQYRVALIDLLLIGGDKDGAVASAREWAEGHHGPDGAVLLAETLSRVQRLPEAATVIAKAQAVRPDWQLTLIESQIAMVRGDHARAVNVLKTWLTTHSTDLVIRQAYGDALLRSGDDSAALAQYEIYLKDRSDNSAVLNNMAWLLRERDPARAMSLATKANQLQPGSPDIGDTLGWLLLLKKDPKGALPVLQKAHVAGPANGQISYHLALAFSQLGRKAEAKQMLQDALAKGGKFAEAPDAKKLLQQL